MLWGLDSIGLAINNLLLTNADLRISASAPNSGSQHMLFRASSNTSGWWMLTTSTLMSSVAGLSFRAAPLEEDWLSTTRH